MRARDSGDKTLFPPFAAFFPGLGPGLTRVSRFDNRASLRPDMTFRPQRVFRKIEGDGRRLSRMRRPSWELWTARSRAATLRFLAQIAIPELNDPTISLPGSVTTVRCGHCLFPRL